MVDPSHTRKRFFSNLDKISCVLFVSIASHPASRYLLRRVCLSLFPHQIFIHRDEMPQSLIFSNLNRLSFFSLSSYFKCSNPLIIPMALWQIFCQKSVSVLHPGAQTWTQFSRCVSPVLSSDKCPPNADKEAACLLC